jgi:hypothetical protein
MRKICRGLWIRKVHLQLSFYMILSKVYQFLEGAQATKILSSKSRLYLLKILSVSILKIFVLQNPYPKCWSKILWRKKNSHGRSNQNSFFQKFLNLNGPYP